MAIENDDVLAISWPGWDKVGMTNSISVYKKLKEYKIPLIKERDAYVLFKKELENFEEKVVFYMVGVEDNALNFTLVDFNKYKKFIGLPIDKKAMTASVDFLRMFDKNDNKFLQEHKVFGEIVLPGSFFVSSAICFSYLYNRELASVKKIKFLSKFILKDKINISLSNNKNVLSIAFKNEDSIKTICHSGGVDKKELEIKGDILDLNFLKKGKKDLIVKNRELYKAISKNRSLVFGDMYKNLGDVYETTNAKGRMYYAEINLSSEIFLDGSVYEKLTRIIDAGFQILGAAIIGENGKNSGLYLPIEVDEISYHGKYSISDRLFIVLFNETLEKNFIKGDINIFNNRDEIIISASGIKLAKVN